MAGNKILAQLSALLSLDTKGFEKGINNAKKHSSALQNSMKQVGAAIAGAFTVGAVVNFSKESMTAYAEQIKSEAKLQTALKGRKDITDRLVSQANLLQSKTLFSDEDIINGQALLATFTQSEEQLKTLTPLVLDYAQAFGMDVASAAKQVGKALISTNGAIGKSGIEAEGAAGSFERYADLVQQLTDKFTGQAEGAIPEALKAQRELTVSLDELKESWGAMVTSIGNAGLFKWISEELGYLSWGLNKVKEEGGGFKKWWQWFWSTGDFTEESFAMAKNAEKNAEQLKKNADILQGVTGGFKSYGDMVEASAEAANKFIPEVAKSSEELAKEAKAAEDAAKAQKEYLKTLQDIRDQDTAFADQSRMQGLSGGAEMNTGLFLRTGTMQFDLPTDQVQELDLALKELPESYSQTVDAMVESSQRLQSAFEAMGAAVGQALGEFIKGEAKFSDVAASLIQEIIKIVAGYLTESVAASFAGGASAGGPAAPFTGAAAAAAAISLFGSLVPALMASGGVVPGGYPGDTYPALLSSGEMVIPPHKLESVMGRGQQTVNVVGVIRGQDIHLVNEKQTSKLTRYR